MAARDGRLASPHGSFSTRLYRGNDGAVGVAVWAGRLRGGRPLSARLHSSCFTSEGLGGLDCDCVGQLDAALRAIAQEQRGVLFYLLQEGRGAGLQSKLRDRELVQRSNGTLDTYGAYEKLGLPHDPRTYAIVPEMCRDLGIAPSLRLMTNNPAKVQALAAAGIEVERVAHDLPPSAHNAAYLNAKARWGHALQVSGGETANAPPGLEALDAGAPVLAGFGRCASYSLPLRHGGGTAWFRATGYTHMCSGHDRVVLTYRGDRGPGSELRDVYRDDLYERLTQRGPQLSRYRAAIERIVAHGAGSILAVPHDAEVLSGEPGPGAAADHALLAEHGEARGATRWEALA